MTALLSLALLLAAPGSAEPLSDKIDREYVQPALQQVQGAIEGREPSWTPPAPPGNAASAKLTQEINERWVEPLMNAHQAYALEAAQSLAAPHSFSAPAEPDLAALVPTAPAAPAAEGLLSAVQRSFLARLFPEEYALRAAAALGSAHQDEGPPPPELDLDPANALYSTGSLAPGAPAPQAVPRFARPKDFKRSVKKRGR